MIRTSSALLAVAVVALGIGTFQVTNEVQQLQDRLDRIRREVSDGRKEIHRLRYEWSGLTAPDRLDALARRHLALIPIGKAQLGSIDQLPMRSPREPQAEPDAPQGGTAAAPAIPPPPPAAPQSPSGTQVAAASPSAAP